MTRPRAHAWIVPGAIRSSLGLQEKTLINRGVVSREVNGSKEYCFREAFEKCFDLIKNRIDLAHCYLVTDNLQLTSPELVERLDALQDPDWGEQFQSIQNWLISKTL